MINIFIFAGNVLASKANLKQYTFYIFTTRNQAIDQNIGHFLHPRPAGSLIKISILSALGPHSPFRNSRPVTNL